jgi:glycosyltransferase involved in cell wall biosynthesis
VGRLVEMKRPLDLVEATARLPDKARWLVAFAGAGPLAASIEARARALSVRVAMLGFVNQAELPRIYGASDLLGLPSSSGETWGLVVNEAMASGLPAVVSDAAGCAPDLIEEGRTGFAFPSGDLAALARALERGAELRSDPGARAALEAMTRAHSPARAAEQIILAIEAVRSRAR